MSLKPVSIARFKESFIVEKCCIITWWSVEQTEKYTFVFTGQFYRNAFHSRGLQIVSTAIVQAFPNINNNATVPVMGSDIAFRSTG